MGAISTFRTFVSYLKLRYNGRKKRKELTIMLFRKEKKYYATLNDRELRLAKYALHQFRNKLLPEGKPAEDVNELLLKLWK